MAVVDSGYATANKLTVGSTVTIAYIAFKVVGIVDQPRGGGSADVYIPLGRAQALAATLQIPSSVGKVDVIYVVAANGAAVPAVQQEIAKLLPGATVTTASSLASDVTGSLASASSLISDLGRWLAGAVLVAAFVVASLLSAAAVTRRVREIGTLKAFGWRTRRIVAQIMGESAVIGLVGAALGIAVGFAGAAADRSPGARPRGHRLEQSRLGSRRKRDLWCQRRAHLDRARGAAHRPGAPERPGHPRGDRSGRPSRPARRHHRRIVRRLARRPATAGPGHDQRGMTPATRHATPMPPSNQQRNRGTDVHPH